MKSIRAKLGIPIIITISALATQAHAQFTFTTNSGAITITKYTGPPDQAQASASRPRQILPPAPNPINRRHSLTPLWTMGKLCQMTLSFGGGTCPICAFRLENA